MISEATFKVGNLTIVYRGAYTTVIWFNGSATITTPEFILLLSKIAKDSKCSSSI